MCFQKKIAIVVGAQRKNNDEQKVTKSDRYYNEAPKVRTLSAIKHYLAITIL